MYGINVENWKGTKRDEVKRKIVNPPLFISLSSIRSSLLKIPRECLGQFIRFRSLPKLYYFLLNECFFLFSLHNKLLYTAVAMAEKNFMYQLILNECE